MLHRRTADALLYTSAMLQHQELIRKLFLSFLIVMVLVGVGSLLSDLLAGTEILLTLLRSLGKR